MLEALVWANIAACLIASAYAYIVYRDVFHPLIYTGPMLIFVYGYMPLRLIWPKTLYAYLNDQQALFASSVFLISTLAFLIGCLKGSRPSATRIYPSRNIPNGNALRFGAYVLGIVGLAGWIVTLATVGGLRAAYDQAYGGGWSDNGYLRDAVQLLIPALLLLLSPRGFLPKSWIWLIAVVLFSIPWILQGLAGARRGPTFIIVVTLVMCWFISRNRRPPLVLTLAGGAALGLLLLILVSNRGKIHFGSDLDVDISAADEVMNASEANEYIFGSGCIVSADQAGSFYWGRRWLAYVFIRPIPRQLWPDKYADVGLERIAQNGGVAPAELSSIMGWTEIPGAAPALVADLWVEFSWASIFIAGFIGWAYGKTWRRAVSEGGFWVIQYLVLATSSLHLITQGTGDIFYRVMICSIPSYLIWRSASRSTGRELLPLTTSFLPGKAS